MSPAPWLRAVGAVVVRPWLWAVAGRQLVALAPPGWWRHRPFLPVPDRRYLAFRLETMYGGEAPAPRGADVVAYLRWCQRHRRALR